MGTRKRADIFHFHDPVYTDIVVARDLHGSYIAYIKEEHYNGNHVYTQSVVDSKITEETIKFIKHMAGSSIYRIVVVYDDGSVRIIQPEKEEREEYA